MPAFAHYSGRDGQPTEAERRLVAACRADADAECTGLADEDRLVAPELIAALATGGLPGIGFPPSGLYLFGAIVARKLVLAKRHVPGGLFFIDCRLDAGMDFDDARIDGALVLAKSRIRGESRFMAVVISGQFAANEAVFDNPGATAIMAQGAQAAGWFMRGARVKGLFLINSAVLSGQFAAEDAVFDNPGTEAVFAQGIQAGAWFMGGARVAGWIDINSAVLSGEFAANGATFEYPDGVALRADSIRAGGWFMRGAHVQGTVDLRGCQVDGPAFFDGATLASRSPFALDAGHGHFGKLARFHFARCDGGISLRSATLSQGLEIGGAIIAGKGEVAVDLRDGDYAGSVRVSARLASAFNANRAAFRSMLDLGRARLTAGSLCGNGAKLVDHAGRSHAPDRALSLIETRIDGRLVMPVVRPDGIVDLSRARCDTLQDDASGWMAPLRRGADQCDDRVHHDGRDLGHIVLDGFEYQHLEWPDGKPDEDSDIVAARITWLAGQSARQLRTRFNPQPWRQLAQVLRQMGHEEESNRIAIARKRWERHAEGVSGFEKFVSRFLDAVAHYGFNPWRTVMVSLAVIALGALLNLWAAGLCGVQEGGADACAGEPAFIAVRAGDTAGDTTYPPFAPVLHSLDMFLPIIDLGTESFWRANPASVMETERAMLRIGDRTVLGNALPLGWLMLVWGIAQRLLGGILVAIAVLGFTGLLRQGEAQA